MGGAVDGIPGTTPISCAYGSALLQNVNGSLQIYRYYAIVI